MPKSKNKRKNGKVKKYVPKPKGISKTKLSKMMEEFQKYNQPINTEDVAELRLDDESLQIAGDQKKSFNAVSSEEEIPDGPKASS